MPVLRVGFPRGPASRSGDRKLRGTSCSSAPQGHRDGNLANFLWDGHNVRIVLFEDAWKGDRAVDLAGFVEHLAIWEPGHVDAGLFLSGSIRARPSVSE
jgi:hypothetical protein